MRGFEAESVARVPFSLQAENKSITVIPDGAPCAPIRNLDLVLRRWNQFEIPGSLALRAPSDVQLHIGE
jgi:hypothetical protein